MLKLNGNLIELVGNFREINFVKIRKFNEFYITNEVSTMTQVRDIVQTALTTGYLTFQAENQLRQLLSARYDFEYLNAFMALQEAAMMGEIIQESREYRDKCRV
jgi:hypothetical protein